VEIAKFFPTLWKSSRVASQLEEISHALSGRYNPSYSRSYLARIKNSLSFTINHI